jgi:hypothetical protein
MEMYGGVELKLLIFSSSALGNGEWLAFLSCPWEVFWNPFGWVREPI